jgi:ParB family chromosome partitioning protein
VFGLSHTQVAQKVGRSREYVSNTIRLLALPDYMLSSLRTGDMSEGHARTLLMLNDRPEEQDTVFREILLKKLSVREVERIARGIASEKIRKKGDYDADLVEMEKKFTETLGTRVSIVKTEFGGRLSIDYFTVEDLTAMLERMKVEAGNPTSTAVAAPIPHDLSQFLEPREIANPRADELMALTNSTGLEMVEEEMTPLPTEVPAIPDVPSEVPAEVPEEAAPVAVVPEVSIPEIPVSAPIAADIESVQPEPEVEEVPEQIPAVQATPAVATESAVVPEMPVVPPAPVVNPVPTADVPRSSLRDQLASLLGQAAKPTTVPVPTPVLTKPVTPAISEPITMTPPVAPVVPTIVAAESDDSSLYNLKDFSI